MNRAQPVSEQAPEHATDRAEHGEEHSQRQIVLAEDLVDRGNQQRLRRYRLLVVGQAAEAFALNQVQSHSLVAASIGPDDFLRQPNRDANPQRQCDNEDCRQQAREFDLH
jgi:hypothetical protein